MYVDNSFETVSPSLRGRYAEVKVAVDSATLLSSDEGSLNRIASHVLLGRMIDSETGLRSMALSPTDAYRRCERNCNGYSSA